MLLIANLSRQGEGVDQSFDVHARGRSMGWSKVAARRVKSTDSVVVRYAGVRLHDIHEPVIHLKDPVLEVIVLRLGPDGIVGLSVPRHESRVAIPEVPAFVVAEARHDFFEQFGAGAFIIEKCPRKQSFSGVKVMEIVLLSVVRLVETVKFSAWLPLMERQVHEPLLVRGKSRASRAFDDADHGKSRGTQFGLSFVLNVTEITFGPVELREIVADVLLHSRV